MAFQVRFWGIHIVPWLFIVGCMILAALAVHDQWPEGGLIFASVGTLFAVLARFARDR